MLICSTGIKWTGNAGLALRSVVDAGCRYWIGIAKAIPAAEKRFHLVAEHWSENATVACLIEYNAGPN